MDAASAQSSPVAALVHSNPYAIYARIASLLHPEPVQAPGVHPSALIDPSAQVAASASIGAFVFVGPRAVVGERAVIGAGCVVGADSRIGADSLLHPRVTVLARCELGERARVHSGVVIGSDGFGFAREADGWTQGAPARRGADRR